MVLFHTLHSLRSLNFDLLNTANIILLPKKVGAEKIFDYRPISLIHSVVKLFTKMLALRLAPAMKDIISKSQSTFIKGRSIHDNFLYVNSMARRFHRNRVPMLLVKLDIQKAFDSVRWHYLLSLLSRLGFPVRWRDWIAALLTTSSSQLLLNGIPGESIPHGRGLRQGDLLSPLLFILAIDPLQRLLQLATEAGLLSAICRNPSRLRTSLYADDAVLFVKPIKEEINTLARLLEFFGEVTGLHCNLQKSTVVPIRCTDLDLDDILQEFHAQRGNFLIK